MGAFAQEPIELENRRVDTQREEQRPQGVTLLDPRGGREIEVPEEQLRVSTVAPMSPSRQTGKMGAELCQRFLAIDRIEGVLKIQLKDYFVVTVCVT